VAKRGIVRDSNHRHDFASFPYPARLLVPIFHSIPFSSNRSPQPRWSAQWFIQWVRASAKRFFSDVSSGPTTRSGRSGLLTDNVGISFCTYYISHTPMRLMKYRWCNDIAAHAYILATLRLMDSHPELFSNPLGAATGEHIT